MNYCQKKFELVERVFDETQHFREKYNAVEGNINVTRKDSTSVMIGWTAGTYLSLKNILMKKLFDLVLKR